CQRYSRSLIFTF
nr:immunoglobulin light chain junction region [Macaca mulatta]MOX85787.1 immunoglobulin light chain junction region [Macaca mulatta]MOX87979.1 immunoglobulin light chain junction region [Macaca mulatta]MOX88547.1 immunoglobulin light chain junction region [Macaca mulatta]MOX88647.1 immunoglobulin light chain junction region [Macaca mulatta]